jgi:hypothetical protein
MKAARLQNSHIYPQVRIIPLGIYEMNYALVEPS